MSTWLIVVLVILGILMLPILLPLVIISPVILFAIVVDLVCLPISLMKAIIVRIAGNDKTITIKTKEIHCDEETETVRGTGTDKHI